MKKTALVLFTVLAGCQSPPPATSRSVGALTAAADPSTWDQIFSDIKSVASGADTFITGYSDVSQYIDIVKALLQLAGKIQGSPDIESQLQAIAAQIDQVAGAITWQVAETDRENLSTRAVADVIGAVQWLQANNDQPLPLDSPQAQESLDAVVQSEKPVAFNRFYVASIISPDWKDAIPDRPTVTNGFVYDWRLGVPSLLHTLSMRIQVIAAEDPRFKTDTTFQGELMLHRSQLQTQLGNMVAGVRCGALVFFTDAGATPRNSPDYEEARCADINTGAYLGQDLVGGVDLSSCYHGSYVDQQCRSSLYNSWYQETVQPVLDSLRRQVLLKMPLFDMQSTIDTLYMYAHPSQPELTVKYQRIPAAGNPSLCLDVKNGNSASGTPVQLWTCNATAAQHWSYDRAHQRIVNTAFNKCLDVSGGDPTPGARAQIWDCNGTDAQRWTWDPETGALVNARGNVLDIANANLTAGATVWTWTKNGTIAQKWLADPYTPVINF